MAMAAAARVATWGWAAGTAAGAARSGRAGIGLRGARGLAGAGTLQQRVVGRHAIGVDAHAAQRGSAVPAAVWTGARGFSTLKYRDPSSKYKTPMKIEPLFDEEGRELIKLRRGGYAVKLREVEVLRESIPTSVKKLNLLCQLIRNMPVPNALLQLRYARQIRSADIMQQIHEGLKRAEEQHGLGPKQLKVAYCIIGRGPYMKRLDIKGRGRAGLITRPFCNLTIVLREVDSADDNPWVPPGQRKSGFRNVLRKFKKLKTGPVPVEVPELPDPTRSTPSLAPAPAPSA